MNWKTEGSHTTVAYASRKVGGRYRITRYDGLSAWNNCTNGVAYRVQYRPPPSAQNPNWLDVHFPNYRRPRDTRRRQVVG
jgi:hypothetical protein